jgi:GH43 family beta-xylosidase
MSHTSVFSQTPPAGPTDGPPGQVPKHRRGRRRVVLVVSLTWRTIGASVIVGALLAAGLTWLLAGSSSRHRGPAKLVAARPVVAAAPQPVLPSEPWGGSILGPGGTGALFPADVADPYILQVGHEYFMYATNPWAEATNIPVWGSTDLDHWRELGDALPVLPHWALPQRTWAPSILALPGRYVMYFTAEDRANARQCLGTAVSTNPVGPFTPDQQILECQLIHHPGSIDGMTFVDHGTPYLLWKSDDNALHRPSTLWSARLSPDGLRLVTAPVPLLRDDEHWEAYTIEAPAMVHKAGQYWLFYSGNYLASTAYAIGYALCAGPLGPCVKQSVGGPWFGGSTQAQGPGEESFFTDSDGDTYMAYSAWGPNATGYPHGGVRYPHLALVRFQPDAPPLAAPKAVAVVASPLRGYYVLTADGTVWAEGGALDFGSSRLPTDDARAMAVMPDGLGYIVLGADGQTYRYGTAKLLPTDPSIFWKGADVARSIAVTPSGHGYAILDDLGVVHPVGDAPPAPAAAPARSDVARGLAIDPSDGGYAILDANGGVTVSGDVSPALSRGPIGVYPSVGIVMAGSGAGYATIDTNGDIRVVGDAPPGPVGEPGLLEPMGTWSGVALLPDLRYLAVRTDSSVTRW